MTTRNSCISFCLLLGLLTTFVPSVQAHKVHIFSYLDNGTVYTESYFSDGKPVIGGSVEARDQKKLLQAKGITNDKGMFSFAYSGTGPLVLTITATMGHRGSYLLTLPKRE